MREIAIGDVVIEDSNAALPRPMWSRLSKCVVGNQKDCLLEQTSLRIAAYLPLLTE